MRKSGIATLLTGLIVAAFFGSVSPVWAQAVFVKAGTGQEGQGFVFRDRSRCWLITAAHLFRDPVRGDNPAFQILMEGQPAAAGYGTATMPFWEGLDLAVGTVRFTSGGPCRVNLSSLMSATPSLSGTDPLRIPDVTAAGQLQWTGARLRAFLSHAQFEVAAERAFKGRSGGFVFEKDTPVGMIVTQTDNLVHGVIHVEEIAMNFQRLLSFRGGAIAPPATPTAPQEAGFDLVVESSTLSPAEVSQRVDDVLVEDRPFIFEGDGELVLVVSDAQIETFSRIVIESDGPETAPRYVGVSVDLTKEGTAFPRALWTGEFDTGGLYDSGQRLPQRMRRLVLKFWDGMGVGPRRIDRIRLY